MENKNKEIVIKINNADANMLDVYGKRFDDLLIELEDKNEVQLAQYKFLCRKVQSLYERADVLLTEKCVPNGKTLIQINNEYAEQVIRRPAYDEVVNEEQWDNKAIIEYIVENKIDWMKELPIDYEELKNKEWFKQAISRGAKLYTTIAQTKHHKEYKNAKQVRLENK